jgi:bacterioferritin-associated ferredoxin
MYVCLCKSVTDHEIRRMVHHQGITTMRQLRDELGVSTQCGRCACCAKNVLKEALAECRGCSAEASFAAAA